MTLPRFSGRQVNRLGATARTVAQRTPETLTVVRYRAQPTAATIARLATTAIVAYLLALLLPVTSRPVLAPLTAMLVAQVTLYQTVRNAVRRVASVLAGVLLAVAFSALIGFTWWSLGITIVAGLSLGYALRLGDHILEVPISAMLILSVGTGTAAESRIIETFLGAAAGMLTGLVFARPTVQPAEQAMSELCERMAALLKRMAAGLLAGSVREPSADWLAESRDLAREIRGVDEALRRAEESVRLNPRRVMLPRTEFNLRHVLETLEHAAITVRGIARSLADSAGLAEDDSPVRDQDIRDRLAAVLEELAGAVRAYGRLAKTHSPAIHNLVAPEMREHLAKARDRQASLSELLGSDPAVRPVGWPLRGELVSHLDRLRAELEAAAPGEEHPPQRERSSRPWRSAWQQGRRRLGAGR
jgi:uncharacterized membrane protein YgaE (UPF0421/DUF939 family)